MRVRILSDLHIDVNKRYPFSMKKDDVFTVLAGDISGDPLTTIEWVKNNINEGILVAGNHIVYNHREKTLPELKRELVSAFSFPSPVSFLDANVGNLFARKKENVLFLGSTFYVDGKLEHNRNPIGYQHINERYILNSINDFVWGSHGMKYRLSPRDYFNMNEETVEKFDEALAKNESSENLPVVIVTHFCPSKKFIHPYYEFSDSNAAFISDFEWFIEKHPSIKAWVCGHVHSRVFDKYTRKDSSECLLLCNPRGYCGAYEDKDWNPNVFLDTETWTIEK